MKTKLLYLVAVMAFLLSCSLTPVVVRERIQKDDTAIVGQMSTAVNTPVPIHTAPTSGSWMYPINRLEREGTP